MAAKQNLTVETPTGDALTKLAFVEAMLKEMEKGDFNGMEAEEYAYFIRCGLSVACETLERELFKRKLIKTSGRFDMEARHG